MVPKYPAKSDAALYARIFTVVFGLLASLVLTGCGKPVPTGNLVVTQVPLNVTNQSADLLDQRYPTGSRVVLVQPPFEPRSIRVLSDGLAAAGDPVVSPAGDQVVFVGKIKSSATWQVYEANLAGGRPKALTAMEGGAMGPAFGAHSVLVFSSPVPKTSDATGSGPLAALYSMAAGGSPQRLTFGTGAAVEPTVLADGRILFVAAHANRVDARPPTQGLFTINNDGTEFTSYALDHDGSPVVHRPRELSDGRIVFVASAPGAQGFGGITEAVRSARPFQSRARLFPLSTGHTYSAQPDDAESILVCADAGQPIQGKAKGSSAVYRVKPGATEFEKALFDDPEWNEIEATALIERPAPMGHISTITPPRQTATLLCLNANFTRAAAAGETRSKAERVRVLAGTGSGGCQVLGQVALQADGSFMAEVPADTPLGFETIDAHGRVLDRLAPSLWLRPGENRSCLGCHEPHNRSPRNVRPLAVTAPPAELTKASSVLAHAGRTP